jgi:hypothetical protein
LAAYKILHPVNSDNSGSIYGCELDALTDALPFGKNTCKALFAMILMGRQSSEIFDQNEGEGDDMFKLSHE